MRVTSAATGALLVLALSGCDQTATPLPGESSPPASETASPTVTETVQGRVVRWDPEGRAIVVDRVAMLSGEEAVAAAREDGQMPEGEETLPNVRLRDDVVVALAEIYVP